MLWNPRGAAQETARAGLWVPLLVLAVAGGLADYPFLLLLGPTRLTAARLEATPEGMRPLGIIFFLALTFAAPVLLPALAWATGRVMNVYLGLLLDAAVERREVVRVTAWGFLPLAVERLLVAGLQIACSSDCKWFNPLASNTAFFLDPTSTAIFWYEAARGLELFSLWTLATVALGLAGLSQQPARFLLPPLVLGWLVLLLVKAWLLS